MDWTNPRFSFPNGEQYAFLFENAHLLLLSWDRDDAKFLFLIKEHRDDGLILDYPGATFTNRVLDAIQNIFFVQVQEETGEARRYVLGSYFESADRSYGAYYERDVPHPEVVLFRIDGDAPDLTLEVLDEAEHERVAATFSQQHADVLEIERASGRVSAGTDSVAGEPTE